MKSEPKLKPKMWDQGSGPKVNGTDRALAD